MESIRRIAATLVGVATTIAVFSGLPNQLTFFRPAFFRPVWDCRAF